MLFSPVTLTNTPIKPRESTFEFIQRDGRQYSIRLRRWIEEWYGDLPSISKESFKRRLTSKDQINFNSALFELQVHTLLRRLKCEVDIEPELPNSQQRLDFHATHTNERFNIEATVSGFGKGQLMSSRNEDDLVEKLRHAFPSTHSDVLLEAEGELRETLSAVPFVKRLRNLLSRFTADEVRSIYVRGWQDEFLCEEIPHGDWLLRAWLSPPVRESRDGRIIGPGRSAVCDGWTPLYSSLCKKARKWKRFDFCATPFLLAVNACHSEFTWYEYDILRALYEDPESPVAFHRSLSCVSGAMVFENVVLGNEVAARVRLFRNGDSRIPECLKFLLEERMLGDLLGIAS